MLRCECEYLDLSYKTRFYLVLPVGHIPICHVLCKRRSSERKLVEHHHQRFKITLKYYRPYSSAFRSFLLHYHRNGNWQFFFCLWKFQHLFRGNLVTFLADCEHNLCYHSTTWSEWHPSVFKPYSCNIDLLRPSIRRKWQVKFQHEVNFLISFGPASHWTFLLAPQQFTKSFHTINETWANPGRHALIIYKLVPPQQANFYC